jgi:hypothetical protein
LRVSNKNNTTVEQDLNAGANQREYQGIVEDSNGNVGIGTSPQRKFHVSGGASNSEIHLTNDAIGNGNGDGMTLVVDTSGNAALNLRENGYLALQTGGSEAARIDSSGNVLVGKTSIGSSTNGCELNNDGLIRATKSSGSAVILNRNTTGGDIVEFKQANVNVGSIAVTSSLVQLHGSGGDGLAVDSSGNVLVSKSTSDSATVGCELGADGVVRGTADGTFSAIFNRETDDGAVILVRQDNTTIGQLLTLNDQIILGAPRASGSIAFQTGSGGSEAMRIDSSGNVLVGETTYNPASSSHGFTQGGQAYHTTAAATCLIVNRQSNDGTLVEFRQANTTEGTISVSGTTVSYNGGHLARWSRLLDGSKPESIKKGTVMTNLDEMIEWAYPEQPEVLWAAGDGLPEGVSVGDVKVEASEDEEGNVTPAVLWGETDGFPEGVSIGDVKTPYKAAGVEDNEQLNHTAVSSIEGDKNVAGVFVSWDESDDYADFNLAMTGDFIIRIAQGTTVQRGDLLVSAGDGTAKPLSEDTPVTVGVHASIVAKVTSTHISETYEDGSYLVPCVLMAC